MIEPYDTGLLQVGDGHRIYWECCGNPTGQPVLYLHGGPGAGLTPAARRYFDPVLHRAILFDQRRCGRSTPLASALADDLRTNTTAHLIDDIEQLRQLLSVERWALLGLSWGTTLALAYAQTHPDRVNALVLALVTTTSRREVKWLTEGVGAVFPEQWARFQAGIPSKLRHLPAVDAYAVMLFDEDAAVRERAAVDWCAWEDAHVSLAPNFRPNPRFEDPDFRLRFARLVTHYWRNAAFLDDEQLIRDASLLNGIPGELINGRYDVSTPLETAWRLSENWRTAGLCVLDDVGHGGGLLANAVTAAIATI